MNEKEIFDSICLYFLTTDYKEKDTVDLFNGWARASGNKIRADDVIKVIEFIDELRMIELSEILTVMECERIPNLLLKYKLYQKDI